jgi:CubicO group peptidase (beta-lactamase class C family)
VLTLGSPENTGFSADRLQRISTLMNRYVSEHKIAGILATVARRGQTVYLEKFGLADVETARPMQLDTILRIMSMSKPITSVATMMLYEEGWFDLNTPISEFIPAFKETKVYAGQEGDALKLEPLQQPITFRHLFTHTAGLTYHKPDGDIIDRLYFEAAGKLFRSSTPVTSDIVVSALARLPLAFQPGASYRYSFAIDVLGRLVEVISGKPLDVFLRERIFEPLGMPDTAFFCPPEKADRLASIYGTGPEGALAKQNLPPELQPPSFSSGGGGLYSTLSDYARFAQMLVNGGELDGARLLSPSTVALFERDQAPHGALDKNFCVPGSRHAGYGYSLGTRVLVDVAASGRYGSPGEFGWDGAYATYFWVDRTEQLYGLLMLQHERWPFPIHQQFKALTYQAIVDSRF